MNLGCVCGKSTEISCSKLQEFFTPIVKATRGLEPTEPTHVSVRVLPAFRSAEAKRSSASTRFRNMRHCFMVERYGEICCDAEKFGLLVLEHGPCTSDHVRSWNVEILQMLLACFKMIKMIKMIIWNHSPKSQNGYMLLNHDIS